jgi:hypothetical protein
MAQSDKDELADALARLADGEVAPSEQEPPAPGEAPPMPSNIKPQRAAAPVEAFIPPPMPEAFVPATPADQLGSQLAEETIVDDEDDDVSVPAFEADPHAPRPAALQRAAVYQTLEFRRTLIPVLLTCGMLLIVFSSARHLLGQDSPLNDLPPWLAPLLLLTGTVLLVLAVLNMLSVKRRIVEHELRVDKLRRRLL